MTGNINLNGNNIKGASDEFHELQIGTTGKNYWSFVEYGGDYRFYKNQGTDILLGRISDNGWEGNVNGATPITSNNISDQTVEKAWQIGDSGNIQWKNALGLRFFFYENPDDWQTLDIPHPYVGIITAVARSGRGIAIAVRWDAGRTGNDMMWINTLHDNWTGWTSIKNA